jgi:membrane protein DedA with SNARE-associated domain
MHDKLMELIAWYRQALEGGGYPLIVLLMAIESSFVPLPSELVIPFAAYYAQSKGHMSLTGVVLAGALGSWIGATVMYWASRIAGRPLVLQVSATLTRWMTRLARWPFLRWFVEHLIVTPEKIEKAERWSAKFGSFGTLASRFLPVVRHLIGIPAGIVRLNYLTYSIYTIVGSALWCSVLAWVGVQAGQDEALMRGEVSRITLWVVGGFAVLGAIYYTFVHRHLKAEKN